MALKSRESVFLEPSILLRVLYMIKIIVFILTASAILYCLHKICLWLEKHGYLYYMNKKADTGFLASTLEMINGVLNPAVKHTIEMKQNQVTVDKQKAEDDSDKNDDQGKRYDNIAKGFADMRDTFYKEQKYLDLFIDHLKPGSKVLDVGSGSGYPIASYLIEKGLDVTGVDSSAELLNIAKEKCPQMKRLFGDIRTISINQKFDGIIEWWCLFHLPKQDQLAMIKRFASWLNPGGILEFTTGDRAYEDKSSAMLDQELDFYSLEPVEYEQCLKSLGFEILLRESDQDQHLVWVARYNSSDLR